MTRIDTLRLVGLALLAFALGAGLGFLCLEVIGVPLLIATLVIGRHAADRSAADLALATVAFGAGFAGSVAWFAVRTSGIFDGSANTGSVFWFGFWLLVGLLVVSRGVARRRRARSV